MSVKLKKNLHILRETKAPAVLVELGFINNSKDREYMTSEKGRKKSHRNSLKSSTNIK
jgi:N-acetylmuramoyl-L-alanine amidase